ncbi:MAG TPA: LPS assembly protein LptD [Thermohalobaculum sp.]|nr:LPS assembly protein LptD [Thermohalobaculum sp.]
MGQATRAFLTVLLALAAVTLWPGTGGAESPLARRDLPVTLMADSVEYDSANGRVTASGSVEVFYGERTLTADRIVYDDTTGRISAEGNIILRDPTGITVFADIADLDTELRDGLVRGARSVMGENVRLSAVEARRTEGRYNTLSKAVYSPCKVCTDDPTPLWRIRARRVIHDEVEKTIHYQDATLDVLGVPVAWLPFFSHPDPTVERATGFLVPEIRQSSVYGWGIWAPYYWVLDDYSDLTFNPFITTFGGALLGGEYRRAFESGRFEVAGTATVNDYQGSQELHGHLEGNGLFDLQDGYQWGFEGKISTDNGYLRRYDISDEDRLTSELFLRRYREEGFFDLTAVYFQSLRDDEPSGTIPTAIPDFDYRREYSEPVLGGDLGFFASSATLVRGEGFDSTRFSLGADWERQQILPSGLVLRGFASARGDLYLVDNFSGVGDASEARLAPLGGVEARLPLIYEQASGTAHVLEPIAQAILAPYGVNRNEIPNEDSLVNEFDETNLFDVSHHSGVDAFEEGPRFNLGLRYERIAADRVHVDAAVGRVLRLRDADEFSPGSGLDRTTSDWVGAWSVGYDPYVRVRQRMRIEDDFTITRNEIATDLTFGRFSLTGGYTFLAADPGIEVVEDREEVSGRAAIKLNRNWTLSGEMRRDIQLDEFVEIIGGLAYANECCEIELFVKRRFTESADAPAATSVGVQIKLLTLGNENASVP